jgi:CRISPR/Cas system CSM-associated protein Csm3 (group 7 of RAMP superfamily)
MPHASLQIDILDLWLFGSGRGEGDHIDSTPLLDAHGLPLVPGRAVKGLLRDATLDLLQLQAKTDAQTQLTALFGTRDHGQTRHTTQAGRLQVTDARLPTALAQALAAQPETRQGLFHDVRATAIDDTTGTARAHSLRSIRTVVPLTLYAQIESAEPADLDLIRQAAHLITALGAHRSRGLGRCACTLQPTTND